MSLATSYRFEIISEKSGLKSALSNQQQRIQDDEMMAERENQAKVEEAILLKSNWNESLARVSAAKSAKRELVSRQKDLCMARKASIMVRQAALKHLLDQEYLAYEQELAKQGKAFYIQRSC